MEFYPIPEAKRELFGYPIERIRMALNKILPRAPSRNQMKDMASDEDLLEKHQWYSDKEGGEKKMTLVPEYELGSLVRALDLPVREDDLYYVLTGDDGSY